MLNIDSNCDTIRIAPKYLFAEIQQTSDITYRIFDWNRLDVDGKPRDLHTDLAIEATDFKHHNDYRTSYLRLKNQSNRMVKCNYFTTNYLPVNEVIDKDYSDLDSFIIYICLKGACEIEYQDKKRESCSIGETLLIPANLKTVRIIPSPETEILEVYIKLNYQLFSNYFFFNNFFNSDFNFITSSSVISSSGSEEK